MTDEQIENWRKIIFQMLEEKGRERGMEGAGSYALIMPKEEIEKFRDMIQAKATGAVAG